jgi:hypothetical protein
LLCRRETFGSRVPDAAGFSARRTRRASDLVGYLRNAVGGRPAQRLTARLGLTASRATILRALKRAQQPASGALRVVGIDDWSWRKGSTYGTLIMDLDAAKSWTYCPTAGPTPQLDGLLRILRST